MTDHILSIALVFSLLAGGTAAIGSELIGSSRQAPVVSVATVTLPMVVVTGRRAAPAVVVATDSVAAEPQRLQ